MAPVSSFFKVETNASSRCLLRRLGLGLGLSLGLDLGLLDLDQLLDGVVVGVDALVVDLVESDGHRVPDLALVHRRDSAYARDPSESKAAGAPRLTELVGPEGLGAENADDGAYPRAVPPNRLPPAARGRQLEEDSQTHPSRRSAP